MANSATLKSFTGITETAPLIIEPATRQSTAMTLTTVITSKGVTYRFPKITDDPSVAWIAENAEIPLSEAVADEVVVTPKKVGGISVISNELANDTSPEAATTIGDGLARKIARGVDLAFFGPIPANLDDQSAGLESLADTVTRITADPASGIDPYIDAQAAAESLGITITAFVVDPATAKALAKLKQSNGSNLPLLGTGATNGLERTILGIPLVVARDVLSGTAWAIPAGRIYTVLREDVTIDVDSSVFFTRDQTAIRGVARIGFGFVQPEAVIKIKAA